MEVEAHLVDAAGGGDGHGGDEVVPSVAAQLAQGDLGAGVDHGLVQPLQHEGQGGGGVGHGVRAVEHHEAVVVVIPLGDGAADHVPLPHGDVRGVQQGIELHQIPLRHVRVAQLGDGLQRAEEGAGVRGEAVLAGHHADGAAGIDDADALSLSHGRLLKIDVTFILNDSGPLRKKKAPEKVCGFVWTSVRQKR